MTATRDPDRLLRAWLDLMPDEAPDRVITSVLQATEHAPQRRRALGHAAWRFSPMNRLAYAAAAVAVVAILAGGALVFRLSSNNGTPPTATPVSPATPAASFTPTAAASNLRATWLASGTPFADAEKQIPRLVIDASGDRLSIMEAGAETFVSTPVVGRFDEFTVVATESADGCRAGDLGRYQYATGSDGLVPNSDGTLLSLTGVEDQCAARRARLEGIWVHAVDAASSGGRGVIAAFRPMFAITLPQADYTGTAGPNWASVVSTDTDRTLVAVGRLEGVTDPCAPNGGSMEGGVDATIESFTAYLATLPGLAVESTPTLVDGRLAALLTISSVETDDCPSHRVTMWSAGRLSDHNTWFLTQGDTDIVCVVDFGNDLVLLRWSGSGVTREEVQALLDTVNFTDTLPPSEY